jgi:hypothetical protein
MNKINLHKYFSVALSFVFLGLAVIEANTVYILYNFQISEAGVAQQISENISFQMEYAQNVGVAVVYLILATYFAAMTIMKFPLIELGKESKSKDSDEK